MAQSPNSNPGVQQQETGHRIHAMRRFAKMAKELGLSKDQRVQIKSILKDTMAQRKSIRTAQLPESDKKAKLQELRKSTHEQVAAVLTPAQREQWKQMHREHEKNKQS